MRRPHAILAFVLGLALLLSVASASTSQVTYLPLVVGPPIATAVSTSVPAQPTTVMPTATPDEQPVVGRGELECHKLTGRKMSCTAYYMSGEEPAYYQWTTFPGSSVVGLDSTATVTIDMSGVPAGLPWVQLVYAYNGNGQVLWSASAQGT